LKDKVSNGILVYLFSKSLEYIEQIIQGFWH